MFRQSRPAILVNLRRISTAAAGVGSHFGCHFSRSGCHPYVILDMKVGMAEGRCV
jgi:hypothetical protein